METLSEAQLVCLKRLAGPAGSPGQSCSTAVLQQLQRMGLVQCVVQGWLPLENQHNEYVISPAGKAVLERLARGDHAL